MRTAWTKARMDVAIASPVKGEAVVPGIAGHLRATIHQFPFGSLAASLPTVAGRAAAYIVAWRPT